MVTTQDASIGFAPETTYGTVATPSRFVEFLDESLQFNKNIKQGAGLRSGARVDRSARRTVTTADAGGDFSLEVASKGLGLLWQAALGAGTSTLVSGTTYQQVFTLGDILPSLTLQKGLPRADLGIDAYTFLGAMISNWEFSFPNDDICSLKLGVDARDVKTDQAYAAPSYPAAPVSLFNFAGGSVSSGTLTPPTATTLATATTSLANVRGGSLSGNSNLRNDRFNFGNGGRKSKPTAGKREISGSMDVEYTDTTFRDAVLADAPLSLLLNFTTPQALSTGVETLQVVIPELKYDNQLPQTNGTDLIVQSMNFAVLDNLTAAQPIWVVVRTSDNAL